MPRNRLTILFPDLLVVACCLVSLGLSVIESRVNTDTHHWGLMYGNAADLHQGLVPYREIFIQYGWLTTLIQSFSLNIFGNRVVSVGIITGIFYAINIYLSYCLWQKILNKWLSSISAVLMFLVHGYIIYPWSNYFAYTFLLASLLFITSSPEKPHKYLFTGFLVGLSLLARLSLLPVLAPFYLYFLLIFFVYSPKKSWRFNLTNIVFFHLGIIVVWVVFLIYLLQESAFRDWQAQTFTILKVYQSSVFILRFLSGLIFGNTFGVTDIRSILYSIIFFDALIIWLNLLLTPKRQQITERDKILFLFSSVILFGYFHALHIYEVFRLQNSASLGFGLLILSLDNLSTKFRQWKGLVFTIPVVCLFLYLSQTLLFTNTSSVYHRWEQDWWLSNQLEEPENVEILKGKLSDEETRNYYQVITQKIISYQRKCQLDYLVNLSPDSYILFLSKSIKKVQISPFYSKILEREIFPDEKEKITKLLRQNKAILVASDKERTFNEIPKNYEIVLELTVPKAIPLIVGEKTYIAVPKNLNCQN